MNSASVKRRDGDANLVEGEFAFTAADFQRIADELHRRAGITLSESKAMLVYSRLAKRVRGLGLASFAAYCDLVCSGEGADERASMINALTTNVTRFYREPHHFEHLRDQVLAPRLQALRSGARLRLWSAACSTGQEPYSMALTVLSVLPEAPSLDIKILATDIDSKVVRQARQGDYAADLVEPIAPDLRKRWMERDPLDGRWRMGPAARAMVSFNELNLMGAWPVKGPFDAIFCRNVVIYFDEATQEKVWSRFAPLLAEQGRLYIGHSERVTGAAAPVFASDGLTVYRRLGARR
jgi:chemotaxis protein methyltransferase CheR